VPVKPDRGAGDHKAYPYTARYTLQGCRWIASLPNTYGSSRHLREHACVVLVGLIPVLLHIIWIGGETPSPVIVQDLYYPPRIPLLSVPLVAVLLSKHMLVVCRDIGAQSSPLVLVYLVDCALISSFAGLPVDRDVLLLWLRAAPA